MAVHDMLMAAAGGTAGAVNYVDDVFSTYLYTGTGANQTINNGIDLADKGGLVWTKQRDGTSSNSLMDTARGVSSQLRSNTTTAKETITDAITAFNANGYSLGADGTIGRNNWSGWKYVSWTFRKQAKFFDVVTYTGDGNTTKDISHSLGSKPGWIILKKTSSTSNWATLANPTGSGSTQYFMRLNTTDSRVFTDSAAANTSTSFRVTQYGDAVTGNSDDNMNDSGATYVAYLFAHDAGGFGTAGTDNVISCGSFTTDSSGYATVNLGYEPQWILTKRVDSSSVGQWYIIDNMRGFSQTYEAFLQTQSATSEGTTGQDTFPTATGFETTGQYTTIGNGTFIYIAIRRPMKPPTTGTEVFSPVTYSGNNASNRNITSGFTADLVIPKRSSAAATNVWYDRLRGGTQELYSTNTDAEWTSSGASAFDVMNGIVYPTATAFTNGTGATYVNWMFKRAPGFFDEVCYTGTGSARTVNHNLGVVPELMIVKNRSPGGYAWSVYAAPIGNTKALALDTSSYADTWNLYWNNTSPTSSVFTVGTLENVNEAGYNYVAYLFATLAGVSKVGSYAGTGTTLQIDCGFTGGARFVLIKRTDYTGDWYVWDTARGIVSGNDPYLLINSTAAETTNTDYIDPYSAGFEISSTAPTAINASGYNYIYLAIA